MYNDRRTRLISGTSRYRLVPFLMALVCTGVLVLASCDSNDTVDENEVAEIVIMPLNATLEVGEQTDFSVVALNASGDTVPNADLDITWWSTDTSVFTVDENGTAIGQESGTAFCMVEATDETADKVAHSAGLLRFTGRDSAFVTVLF